MSRESSLSLDYIAVQHQSIRRSVLKTSVGSISYNCVLCRDWRVKALECLRRDYIIQRKEAAQLMAYIYICVCLWYCIIYCDESRGWTNRLGQPIMTMKKRRIEWLQASYIRTSLLRETRVRIDAMRAKEARQHSDVGRQLIEWRRRRIAAKSDGLMTSPTAAVAALAAGGG
jgi:hypothetical protein